MLRRPYASPASYLEQVAVHAILFIVYLVDVYRGNHNSVPIGVVFT